jgi:hypothetical protein
MIEEVIPFLGYTSNVVIEKLRFMMFLNIVYISKKRQKVVVTHFSLMMCTHLTTRLSSIITTITGQETIGSKRQSDLLTVGVNTPETC